MPEQALAYAWYRLTNNRGSWKVVNIQTVLWLINGKQAQANASGAEITNDLRETLTYGELLKRKFYLILRNLELVSYSTNFIKCLYNRSRGILNHNFLRALYTSNILLVLAARWPIAERFQKLTTFRRLGD